MKNLLPKLGIFVIAALTLSACTDQTSKQDQKQITSPENIIFIIGDGMGIAQLNAAMEIKGEPLAVNKLKHTGFSKTNSASSKVTDSAAAGTALACGTKTNNGMLGISPSGDTLVSLMENAQRLGMSTGFSVTCAVTHATPASFYAKQDSRENTEAIASDLSKAKIDFYTGGGYNYFANRTDSIDLISDLLEKSYSVSQDLSEIDSLAIHSSKIAGLYWPEHPPRLEEGRKGFLQKSVAAGLNYFNHKNEPFFYMIEASQIDWGGHAQDIDYVIEETLEFDEVVQQVLDFAKKDSTTLVVITADHETGGLTLLAEFYIDSLGIANFSTGDHTGVMVPIFAFGPGAENFTGTLDNTEIHNELLKLLKH